MATHIIMAGFDMFPDYQSLDQGSKGEPGKANRSIPDRIMDYGLDKALAKDKTVLDLGCNRGYFGILLAPHIEHYTGVEYSSTQVQFGMNEKISRGLTNVAYKNEVYSPNALYGRFDIILCLAFHIYTGVTMEVLAKHLADMLKPEGRLFLEGHPPGYHLPNIDLNEPDSYWTPLNEHLSKRLKVVEEKSVKDRELTRPFKQYKK